MTELKTIPAALRRAADDFPDHDAVVDGDVRWTFRDLLAEAERVAGGLQALGVAKGDRVALWAPNSASWIAASFGAYLAGAVLVPINTRYKGDEAGHVLRTSGARTLLTVGRFLDADYLAMLEDVDGLDALQDRIVLDGWVPEGTYEPVAIHGDDPSDIIFTSGTTGAPKGAVLGHRASVQTYLSWSELVDLREGDRYACVYPFFHTAGLKSGVLACTLRGAAIYPLPVFDVPVVMDLVARERITMLPGPPTVFQTILEHPDRASFDLSSLRSSVTGAAVVPVETVRRMRDDLGIKTVVTGYGMTETTGTISMCRHDDPPEVIAHTVGRPIPGVEVRILDDGEIVVRGFNVMQSYFANPEATAETIVDGWLHTGDIGFVDDGGNLHITDRKKDMFIVGGFNAYPAEIEKTMMEHPAIGQVAVVGVPDERMGEVGVAFVVPAAGATVDPDEVVSWCKEGMANFKVPRRIEVVDALPLNPTGKVLKYVLRERAAAAS